jgi:ribosomal protein L37AE/L43A
VQAVAEPLTMTLDDALAGVLESLADGHGDQCLVCGSRAFAVRERTGWTIHSCRSCGSTLEQVAAEPVAYRRYA